ncbi:Spy/CpxP family protein refolding chaperone [Tanticharoenia sakaeratensis]|jgi:periplasmic protein CpxP/Spy|uniref:Periplasmic heavy metal sensor n=1 Tax=Tanticharoenia sakaeratensis NBRC 103193 TaxID=1231623 RepID=A0A0D6MKW3_9PROT|nr:Spy/CpxP family protein refolding chaperone [Tanticharoenia sakaeratensis]GAN54105.1 hypothetical protein Tasa_016_025 [Tanticharoenia sakaeratensis NBRC 103193]GBQ24691.1 hypothetical protein AA103193_2825 [Tanticharoenia sakaeratensis NBRC 103193]
MFAKTVSMLGLLALTAAPAFAQGGPPGPGHHGGPGGGMGGHHGMMPMLPGVKLTDQQKSQMHAIFEADHGNGHGDWKQEKAIDSQIGDLLLQGGKIDRARLAGLIHQKDVIEEAHEQAWIDSAIKVHDILTPEQLSDARATRAKLDSLREQMHALMHDADDHGAPPPPEGPSPD